MNQWLAALYRARPEALPTGGRNGHCGWRVRDLPPVGHARRPHVWDASRRAVLPIAAAALVVPPVRCLCYGLSVTTCARCSNGLTSTRREPRTLAFPFSAFRCGCHGAPLWPNGGGSPGMEPAILGIFALAGWVSTVRICSSTSAAEVSG